MAALVVHPRQTVGFDQFEAIPGPAIALDGYVSGPTRFVGDHANFNHHEGCERFTTRATCEQVALALRMHLPLLSCPTLAVHVNDPDPDVCMSVWLLEHPDAVDDPAIDRLCMMEGAIDTSGGTCLAGHSDDIDILAWVIEPWAALRPVMASLDAGAMAAVIRDVGLRLDAVRDGSAGRLDTAASYDLVERNGGVWAIVEHHPLARARAVADGAEVFVAVRPGQGAERQAMTVGKASPFVALDLDVVYDKLNAREGIEAAASDRWGGSDLVGGSPRSGGTSLTAAEVITMLAAVLTPSA